MKKADIAKSIHEQAGISETQAADLLEWVLALLTSTLQQRRTDYPHWLWQIHGP